MASFSATIYAMPPSPAQQYGIAVRPLDAWQLATIEWGDNQLTGFVNKTAAIAGLPDGLVVEAARIAPDGLKRPKRQSDIEANVSSMQSAKIKFQDKSRSLSQLIAGKRANGIGLRGKVLRLYEWEAGDNVDLQRDLVGTYRLDDRGWLDGYRTLTGLDIRRQLKEKIFEPETYRLAESISEIDTTIVFDAPYSVTGSHELPFVRHNERYSSDPSETVLYVRLPSDEIVKIPQAYMEFVTDTRVKCFNCKRGALNTSSKIAAVEVNPESEPDNRPGLIEWVYLEETLPNMIKMITTGASFDSRYLPRHHHIDMDHQWLDDDSLLYSAPELANLPLRVENYGSVTVKDLIEKEILPFLPATMQVNAFGQIQIRRITTVKKVGADKQRFDSETIDRNSLGEVTTQVSHIRSAVAIRAGWDARTEKFGTPIYFSDAAQRAANDSTNDADVLVLESKLLHSSINTNAQIRRLLPALAEHYLGENLVFSLRAKPTAAIVDVGNRAHVYLEDVPDDASLVLGTPDIDRSMLVTSVDPQDGGTVYQFKGTNGLAAEYFDTLTAPSLTEEDYLRNATLLNEALPPGVLIENAGIYYLQPGTHELSFRKKYAFMLGPLYHTAGSTIVCAPGEEGPMLNLWVPFAWHSDSPTTVVTTGKGGKAGGVNGQLSASGFAVPTIGIGSVSASATYDTSDSGDYQITSWTISSKPGVQYESYTTGDVPSISLSFNDGALMGLPSDLSGYPGCPGGDLEISTRTGAGTDVYTIDEGGNGVANSSGVFIMCRGASMAPNARFVVNGKDGTYPETVTMAGGAQSFAGSTFYTSAGSASGPGTVMIGIDGPFTAPDISQHVEAYAGETFYEGDRLLAPRVDRLRSSEYHSHFEALPHTVNYAEICSRVLYVPARATVQEKINTGIFSSLAISRQKDGLIRLYITNSATVPPSDGLPGDMGIWSVELDSNKDRPLAWVMDDTFEWVPIDWDTAPSDYETLLFVNREFGGTESILSPTRPVGKKAGTHWLDSSTGQEWILGATAAEDRPFRVGGVPVSDDLVVDGNFAQSGVGHSRWIVTRDAELEPVNVLLRDLETLAAAFITHTQVEGEYVAPDGTSEPDPGTVLPPYDLNAFVISDTQIRVSWTNPTDISFIASHEITIAQTVIDTISPGPQTYLIEGLIPSTQYTVGMRNVGLNDTRSTLLERTVTTAATPAGSPLGIQLSSSGQNRIVSGTAYQDNASILIESGRDIILTLNDGSDITLSVGAAGAFSFTVSAFYDANLGKQAVLYSNNGDNTSQALLAFIYEL